MFDYRPHSIDEVQRRFIEALARNNSPVNDASPGSALYALSRSVSSLYVQYELLHRQLYKDSWFATAEGDALDEFALSLGLIRHQGSMARGKALFTTRQGTYVLQPGTLLSDLAGDHFYRTLNQQAVVLGDVYEVAVEIESLAPDPGANKPAGTRLYINAITGTEVSVQVGAHRDASGACCSGLVGGARPETDVEFRQRIFGAINGRFTTTEAVVRNLVLNRIPDTKVKVITRVPGIVEVWLSNTQVNNSMINEIRALLASRLPAGILVSVGALERVPIVLSATIRNHQFDDIDTIYGELTSRIEDYLNTLDNGQYFFISQLERHLNTGRYQVSLTSPSVIPVLQSHQMYFLDKLNISFLN